MEIAAIWITALASVAMAFVGYWSYRLSKQAIERGDRQQRDFEDLLEALVIATMISGPSSYGAFNDAIKAFKAKYKGSREIFKD